ncbi:amidohydrolase [Leucobacter sp. 7(1)]|uniref:amidohydrolase n=1 Tax=Leucobacter sp. 7(1) TaxID=1255613 RepID=UPI0015950F86|nr:amidohydrolase [Leucobacter sp. 7(1)]
MTDQIAVSGGRIVAIGEAAADLPARETVDLGGATAVPGLNDAHFHLSYFGRQLESLYLGPGRIASLDDLYAAVEARAQLLPPGDWVLGHGYYSLDLGAHPDRHELDRRSGGRPVFLAHQCGHLAVANSAAFWAAGVDPDRPEEAPVGGEVAFDNAGSATGLLVETARELVARALPEITLAQQVTAIGAASSAAAAMGLTSVSEPGICAPGVLPGSRHDDLRAFQLARVAGTLNVRATVMPLIDGLQRIEESPGVWTRAGGLGAATGFGDEWLRLGPVKIIADGSLSGRSAFVREDYEHEPGNRGLLQHRPDTLRAMMYEADRAGWQLAIHAMGDATSELVVEILEELATITTLADFRPRIEHFSLVDPKLVARAAALGLVPVPQSRFIGQFGHGYRRCLGDHRVDQVFPIQSLIAAGMYPAGSSDAPISDGDPVQGIADMVRRIAPDGRVIAPAERVSVEQALLAYTRGSAWAEGTESWKGRLIPGHVADFTVLDRDPLASPVEELAEIRVRATVVGGEITFTQPA